MKRHGGVAVLNWHTEAACRDYIYKGRVETLERILAELTVDSDAWVTTPANIVKHWHGTSRTVAAAA